MSTFTEYCTVMLPDLRNKKSPLRTSATGGTYIQNFFNVQHIIIPAILSLKSIKNFQLLMKTYSVSITNSSHAGYEDFPRTAFGKRLSAWRGIKKILS